MNIEKYKKELESGIYEGVQDGTFYIGGKVVEKVLRDAVNEALAISHVGSTLDLDKLDKKFNELIKNWNAEKAQKWLDSKG